MMAEALDSDTDTDTDPDSPLISG